jgi:hypothetical protein
MEWSSYYHRKFQRVIKPRVEKRARELKVEVVLRFKNECVWIPENTVKDQELQMVKRDAGHCIRANQEIAPCWQDCSVKACSFDSLLNLLTPNSLVSLIPSTPKLRDNFAS